MWLYIARRIVLVIPIAIGVSIVCFALVYLAPGDPIQSMMPADASPADIALIKRAYGFDKPVPIQYLNWLMRAPSGDLGISLQTHQPVFGEVMHALSNTVVISFGAVLLAFSFAFVLGIIAACNIGRPADRVATGISVLGVSVPNYWLGIVLIIVFAVQLGWLPATGMGSKGSQSFDFTSLGAIQIRDPADHHAVAGAARRHHAQHARRRSPRCWRRISCRCCAPRGSSGAAVVRHAVRNALPQILAVMGLQFGYLVGGSILIETIFTWPGTGFLLSKAILTRDIPLLQGTILILSLSFVATNLIVDLLQTAVDPRIKRA